MSARQWTTIGLLEKNEILRGRDHRNTGAHVFDVTEFISEVSFDLRGCIEAVKLRNMRKGHLEVA